MFERNFDENCCYTFHLYPFLILPNDLNAPDISDKLQASLYNDVTLNHLRQQLKKPLWCGETGHTLHQKDSWHVLDTFLSILENENIGWALWPLKDRGAMGLTHLKKDCTWNLLCNKLSENWQFFDLFTKDSILASEKNNDKYAYYKWLANESNKGVETVRKNIGLFSFDDLLLALEDFSLKNCIK